MLHHTSTALACAAGVALAGASASAAVVTAVDVDTDGETLNSVTVDQGGTVDTVTYSAAQLQTPDLTTIDGHTGGFFVPTASPVSTPPPQGDPVNYLSDDSLLTGFNVPSGDLRVTFAGAIRNEEGAELIIIDFGDVNTDISVIDKATSKIVTVNRLTSPAGGADETWDANVGTGTPTASVDRWDVSDGNIDNLAELQTASYTREATIAGGASLPLNAVAIDLSDLGYASGEVVTGLEVQIQEFNGLDLVYVGAIPEPGSLALLGLGGGMMLFRQRRRG